MLVEPRHVSGTAEKFAAGGGVHAVLGEVPCAPGPRPKRVAGGVHNGVAQAVHPAKGSAVVDGAGNAGKGGVGLVGAFADDGANRVAVADRGRGRRSERRNRLKPARPARKEARRVSCVDGRFAHPPEPFGGRGDVPDGRGRSRGRFGVGAGGGGNQSGFPVAAPAGFAEGVVIAMIAPIGAGRFRCHNSRCTCRSTNVQQSVIVSSVTCVETPRYFWLTRKWVMRGRRGISIWKRNQNRLLLRLWTPNQMVPPCQNLRLQMTLWFIGEFSGVKFSRGFQGRKSPWV